MREGSGDLWLGDRWVDVLITWRFKLERKWMVLWIQVIP